MSLKNLFGKSSENIVSNKELQKIYDDSESKQYVEQIIEEKNKFIPVVDFSSASNFARYGSAERYYVDSLVNIYQNYPYDGSKKEKLEWKNRSTPFDLYVFENLYPKTTGYINLSANQTLLSKTINFIDYRSSSLPQYVTVKGGPNPAIDGKFDNSNIYDLKTNRECNLGITQQGNTVEFWFKDEYSSTGSLTNTRYALFDLWNGKAKNDNSYSRLLIENLNGSSLGVTYMSGSAGADQVVLNYALEKNKWHHYAFVFKNNNQNNNNLDISLFVDGNLALKTTTTATGKINLANNSGMIANIGAYRTNINANDNSWNGLGVSHGSYDEFRFWKIARNSKQIFNSWHRSSGGGTNKDTANTNLGIYFKFNEGVIDENNINDLDKICLDYSGRLSNGLIVNYSVGVKNVNSAIDEYFSKEIEEKEPIIFSSNPLVQQAINQYSTLGYQYDQTNPTSFYKSIPSWIIDETENKDYQDLNYLIQIISSYFDSLHLYIEKLPRIKDIEYLKSVDKQKTFTKNLLTSHGFEFSDIFSDASLYEELFSSTEKEDFADKLYNVKNAIYQNIYNNLTFIYKSKGTEKSLRNLIRCFGVDDELIKINLYANNITYDLKDRYVPTTAKKKYINFNNTDKITGFIYQKQTPGNPVSKGYITGSSDDKLKYIPLTFETEVIFPKRNDVYSIDYFSAQYTDVSLFGVHSAKDDENDLSWGSDKFNFHVYAVKTSGVSPDIYFKLSGSFNGEQVNITSSVYKNVYNNEKWNLSVRLYPNKLENINLVSGSEEITNYFIDFVGYNVLGDDVNNNFILTSNVSSNNYELAIRQNKRLYAGAHYENFDGSTIKAFSDVKISTLRLWFDYLNNEELLSHALEVYTHGRQYPNWNPKYLNSIINTFTSSYILSTQDTLILDWTFEDITSSDNNGQFYVKDFSSGSLDDNYSYGLGWLSNYLTNQYTAFGDRFFPNDSSTIENQYVYSLKKQQPETLNSNDLIDISPIDDFTRTKQSKPYTYFIAIEKSMAQVINDEILDWFATIKDFNNLIGDPSERYRIEYSGLAHLRKLFFSRVNNEPSYEKFLEFYKWIDSSITVLINQILPASANITDKVRNVVESHILERNKYENKLPTLEFKGKVKSYPVQSHLEFNYLEQAAGISSISNNVSPSRYYNFKPLWLKNRVERDNSLVDTELLPQNDIDREILRQVINNKNLDTPPTVYLPSDTSGYEHDTYKIRSLSRTYKLNTEKLIVTEDVINPVNIQNRQFTGQIEFAEELENSSSSQVLPKAYRKQGNYYNKYEYLQTSGRTDNNKSFVSASGNLTSTSSVNELGYADKSLIERTAKKNIFVERFSAPGGAEINSRGALDRDAEEYSVYNNLNYRNYRVRKNLHTWLAESMSINPTSPSYHKVNRNSGYMPGNPYYEFVGGSPGSGPIPVYYLSSSAYIINTDFGTLYDSGGEAGDYNNDEQRYVFIEPNYGINQFTINSFASADINDKLRIYYNPDPLVEPELPSPFGGGGSSGWSDFSMRLNEEATCLVNISGTIYAGGRFSQISKSDSSVTTVVRSLAAWNGGEWMPLSGGGVGISDGGGGYDVGYVYAMYQSGNYIYVGGDFDTVGVDATNAQSPIPAANIAIYDTTTNTWSSFASGYPNTVCAIAKSGSYLYVGGDGGDLFVYSTGIGIPFTNDALGNTFSGGTTITCINVTGSEVWVGGDITVNFGGAYPEEHIAIIDNGVLKSFAEKVSNFAYDIDAPCSFNGFIEAIEFVDQKVYLGGNITSFTDGYAGGNELPINYICVYNSGSGLLQNVGNGFDNIVYDIKATGSYIYAGGSFESSGALISRWDGSSWNQIGEGISASNIESGVAKIENILLVNNSIYVCGYYLTSSYGTYALNIGRYDFVSNYQLLAELTNGSAIDYSVSPSIPITTYPYNITIPAQNSKFLITWVSNEEDTDNGFSLTWNGNLYIPPSAPELILSSVDKSIKHDNEYVVHQIPRNDIQYAWMTASAIPSLLPYGYITGYNNQYFSTLSFLSGSISGSEIIDYVGLNNIVIKSVDTSSNTIFPVNPVTDVNKYISNLNGPYQGASWKQIRGTENKLVNNSRKTNHILVQDVPKIRTIINNDRTKTTTIDTRSLSFTSYKEPAIDYNYPMEHRVQISSSLDGIQNISIVDTYDNNKNMLSNTNLSIRLSLSEREELQTHDLLNNLSKEDVYDPKPSIDVVSYIQQVYPSRETVTIKEVRVKDNYDDNLINSSSVAHVKTYWKENYIDRRRIDGSSDLFSSINSSYEALTNFTSSILGKYSVLHNVSGTHYTSIYSIDNLTGCSTEYSGTTKNDNR